MSLTEPPPRLARALLLVAIDAERVHYAAKARELTTAAAAMIKPGEKATRRALEAKQRRLDTLVYKLGEASRALQGEPVE